MEKEQIVKALECCSSKGCETCPCSRMPTAANCVLFTTGNALSLIREQDKRIKELENICESYALQYGTVVDKEVFLKKKRADTVRKMQEAIKERCIKGGIYPVFVKKVVEAVAKELLEDAPPRKAPEP